MSISPITINLRAHKLGLIIRDARVYRQRSVIDCANRLGISETRLNEYELGESSPSLPEVEILAEFLNLPLQHFWGSQLLTQENKSESAADTARWFSVRQRIISVRIKQLCDEQGISLENLSQSIGAKPQQLEAYFLNIEQIPLPTLEAICQILHKPIEIFLDRQGPGESKTNQIKIPQIILNLPEDMQDFISKPINLPYLNLAQRLSKLPVDKLRQVAEGLLEITL